MVSAVLLGLYGAAASGVYMLARTAAQNIRIEGGESGGARGPSGHIGAGGGYDGPGSLYPGRRVRVQGLEGRPELNGQVGVVMMQDGERLHVRLEGGDVKLRPANLAPAD
mmetsp:Transcript_26848/g.70571  ORF Transcript_26848/g.70571 Transcript_26848/m.70571 type:complete len:110 (-) Transcript_26848:124-453(-)